MYIKTIKSMQMIMPSIIWLWIDQTDSIKLMSNKVIAIVVQLLRFSWYIHGHGHLLTKSYPAFPFKQYKVTLSNFMTIGVL